MSIDTRFDEIAAHVAAGHFSQSEGLDQYRRIARELERENAKLREALQELCDEQNGPPLERRSMEWNRAYENARALLA